MKDRRPSERPIRNEKPKGRPIWRVPEDGYVTPRLRQVQTNAIGFVHKFEEKDDE